MYKRITLFYLGLVLCGGFILGLTPGHPAQPKSRLHHLGREQPSAVHSSPRKHLPRVSLQTVVFGHSIQNRPLTAYILGDGANVTMVFGGFHGNERSSPGVVKRLITYLKNNSDQLSGRQIVLVPCANPDGWAASTRVNADHVDINRNFPGTWRIVHHAARNNPGRSPASEPETRAIMDLIEEYSPSKVISIHQPLHLINWTGKAGEGLAARMRRYNGYRISRDVGYTTPGAFGDYCGNVKRIAIVTLELPNEGIAAAWRQNKDALMAAIKTDPSILEDIAKK